MDSIIVIISALAYGCIGTFIIANVYQLLALFHLHSLFLQPFVLKVLAALQLPPNSFTVAAVWVTLLFLGTIIFFQIPFVQTGLLRCENITRSVDDSQAPIRLAWGDVCRRAGVSPDKYRLYVKADPTGNAFALGHSRIVIHSGLLTLLTGDELKGVLAHELSHLLHRDTTYGMTAYAINRAYAVCLCLFNLLVLIVNAVLYLIRYIPFINLVGLVFSLLITVLSLIIRLLNSVTNGIFLLLSPFGSRRNEYRADAFAHRLGLGDELASSLAKLAAYNGREPSDYISRLLDDHPPTVKRIARLQALSHRSSTDA